MYKWFVPLQNCQTFVAANNMRPTILGWPNGALEQYESRLPYNPSQRMHLRVFQTHCECEVEPAPETDPGHHLKDDVVPAAMSGIVGAGVGAMVDERQPSRGAAVGGLLGLGSYLLLRWISK
jgi:hypothetical protein